MSLTTTLTRIGRIAAVPLQKRRSQGSLGSLWFTLGFAMFLPVLTLIGGFWVPGGFFIGGVFLLGIGSLLALGAWAVFLDSVFEQAQFASTSLVPGHGRHLGLALATGATVLCAIVAAGFAIVFRLVVAPAIVALVVLTIVAIALHWRWVGAVLLLFGLTATVWPSHPGGTASVDTLKAVMQGGFLFGPIAVAACIAILWLLAPSHRPRPARKRLVENMRAGAGDSEGRPAVEMIGQARDCEAAKAYLVHAWWRTGQLPPEQGDPLQRALAVFPVNIHWAAMWRWKWRRWMFLVALTGLLAIDSLKGNADMIFGAAAYFSMTFMTGEALAAGVALYATRREQQLVALLPTVPRGAVLNRSLALRLSASYAVGVAQGFCALQLMRVVMVWSGAPLSWLQSQLTLVAMPLACLPLAALLWTNWAEMKSPARTSQVMLLFLPMLLAGAAVLACNLGWTRIGAIALLYAAPTVLWCAWRWQRMGNEPPALPAGRLTR